MTKKDDTPQREARRRYEEKNKEARRAASVNFQTMIPRGLYEEIDGFLRSNGITKVDFIKKAYDFIKSETEIPPEQNEKA